MPGTAQTGSRPETRPESRPGTVTLVGAGPGDPELLTVQAIKAIRRATVLLVDDLVGAGVLRYARRSARVLHVGKRGGCRSTPQAFIHKLMVNEAQRGETVVRLKGGDPFIFGRGGEEAEHLRAAGLAVRVVNGISSGLAAATALGVPWTHRAHAQGVMLVTGHGARAEAGTEPGEEADSGTAPAPCRPGPDWATLAAAAAQGLTLVVYMGVQRLATIQTGLLQGLPAHMPAALVQHASTPQQKHLLSTLGRLPADAQAAGIASPAILIVGDVLQGAQALQQQQASRPPAAGPAAGLAAGQARRAAG